MPAEFVKPFVKSQKNDTIDADAIAEALTRPRMRFTQVRTIEQINVQALHRMRDQRFPVAPGWSTKPGLSVSNKGLPCDKAAAHSRSIFPRVLADDSNDLSAPVRQMLSEILTDISHVDQRISSVTR